VKTLPLVIVGHVDHGKSTILGRLLADIGALPDGKLEQVKNYCAANSKPFEYAFLLDALKEEQSQGITIDAARCFFKTAKRRYLLLDAPGHVEFIRNMVTGASHADGALLVIDAKEGIQENTKRHGYFLSLLGIKQLAVLVNKMDLVGYDAKVFHELQSTYGKFLEERGFSSQFFLPVSGFSGDNIATRSSQMPWYKGPTLLEVIDQFEGVFPPENAPCRFPIQSVYKFTEKGDDRRVIAGRLETGKIHIGDTITFYPSKRKSKIRSLEGIDQSSVSAGMSIGMTLEDPLYLTRGEIGVVGEEESPCVAESLHVRLFWLDEEPLEEKKQIVLKLGTKRVHAEVGEIFKVIDSATMQEKKSYGIKRHEVGEVRLDLDEPIACDIADEILETSRFVLVNRYRLAGGGMIQKILQPKEKKAFNSLSSITPSERAHAPKLIYFFGEKQESVKAAAQSLEKALFQKGSLVYALTYESKVREMLSYFLDAGLTLILVGNKAGWEEIVSKIPLVKRMSVWIGEQPLDSICSLSFSRVDIKKIISVIDNESIDQKSHI